LPCRMLLNGPSRGNCRYPNARRIECYAEAMPYRRSPPAVSANDDSEHAAILSLAASAARVRRVVLLPGILLGFVSAAAGDLVLREFQFAVYGVHFPWLSATVGGIPFFLAWLRIARRVGNSIVRRSAPRWV